MHRKEVDDEPKFSVMATRNRKLHSSTHDNRHCFDLDWQKNNCQSNGKAESGT